MRRVRIEFSDGGIDLYEIEDHVGMSQLGNVISFKLHGESTVICINIDEVKMWTETETEGE